MSRYLEMVRDRPTTKITLIISRIIEPVYAVLQRQEYRA